MDPATFKLTGWRLVQPINFTRPREVGATSATVTEVVAPGASEQNFDRVAALRQVRGNCSVLIAPRSTRR